MESNLNTVKTRDAWLDNAKGFLMITVVVGHLIASIVKTYETMAFLSNFIYLFHMPVFAFISGYLMKGRVHRKDYTSVINKTVVPYMVAQVLIYLCGIILPDGVEALSVERLYESGVFSFLFPIYHLWYFWGVIISFVFCVCIKAEEHPVKAFVVSMVISLASGFVPTVDFFRLTKVLAFLPFFVLGNIICKTKVECLKDKKIFMIPGGIIIFLSALCIWLLRSKGSLTGIFGMNSRFFDFRFGLSAPQALLVRLGFIIVAFFMTFAVLSVCPRGKTFLTYLGKNSLYIYILHVIPIAVVRHINYETGVLHQLDSPLLKILFVMGGVLLTFLLASKPVVKVFKPWFEPAFDIRKLNEYLKIEK